MVKNWINGEGQFMEIKSICYGKCPKCGGRIDYTYEKNYECNKCENIWDIWELFLIHIFNLTEEDLQEAEK